MSDDTLAELAVWWRMLGDIPATASAIANRHVNATAMRAMMAADLRKAADDIENEERAFGEPG